MGTPFDGLLAQCVPGAAPPGLFESAWAAWGANARTFNSDPQSALLSIQKAKQLFEFLDGSALEEKQRTKVAVCLKQISSLLVMAAPTPKPNHANPSRTTAPKPASKGASTLTKNSAYAGGIAAPKPEALPSPSILMGTPQKLSPPVAPVSDSSVDPISFALEVCSAHSLFKPIFRCHLSSRHLDRLACAHEYCAWSSQHTNVARREEPPTLAVPSEETRPAHQDSLARALISDEQPEAPLPHLPATVPGQPDPPVLDPSITLDSSAEVRSVAPSVATHPSMVGSGTTGTVSADHPACRSAPVLLGMPPKESAQAMLTSAPEGGRAQVCLRRHPFPQHESQ